MRKIVEYVVLIELGLFFLGTAVVMWEELQKVFKPLSPWKKLEEGEEGNETATT